MADTPPNNGYNSELKPSLRQPRAVLQDFMVFYESQAKDLIADIILRLKETSGRGSASELAYMFKKFSECADIAIKCAEKLAPYLHPKLESIEVKKELTHRFVLRAPPATIDTKAWLATAQDEQKLLASKPGHDLVAIDDKFKDDPLKRAIGVSAFPTFPDEEEYYPDDEEDNDDDNFEGD